MRVPVLGSRIEEGDDSLRLGIDRRQVRAFVAVAAGTGKRKIPERIIAAVLSRTNMLDLEPDKPERPFEPGGNIRSNRLLGAAPGVVSPRPSVLHVTFQDRTGFRLQHGDEVDRRNVRVVFLTFRFGQLPLLVFFSQSVQALLRPGVGPEFDQPPGHFGREI